MLLHRYAFLGPCPAGFVRGLTWCGATGLPLLLPFALVGTMVSFWMDKVFLLRFSKTPIACVPCMPATCCLAACCLVECLPVVPFGRFNDGMAKRATQIMPFGLLLHMGFGIWMLGNTNIVAVRVVALLS